MEARKGMDGPQSTHMPSFPILPKWFYNWLIILGAWRIIMMLSCIAIFMIPVYKGEHSRKKHLWLMQKRYSCGSTPYLIPNKTMIVVLCELLAGVMYFVLACLYYTAFRTPRPTRAIIVAFPWSGISLLPTYTGIWLSGWGWLHACHSTGFASKTKAARFFRPRIFNTVYIAWAVFVVIITALWALLIGSQLKKQHERFKALFEQMKTLESPGPMLPTNDSEMSLDKLQKSYESLSRSFIDLGSLVKSWSYCWIFFELILVAFYASILYLIFRRIHQILKHCKSQQALFKDNVTNHEVPKPKMSDLARKASMALAKLKKELHLLILYNGFILLVLFGEVGVACLQVLHSQHLNDPNWLCVPVILSMVPSTFISPTLLLQCWRMFTERSCSHSDHTTPSSTLALERSKLPIFYDQLLKWYDDPNIDETEVLQFNATFSGLIECTQDPTRTLKSKLFGNNYQSRRPQFSVIRTVAFNFGE